MWMRSFAIGELFHAGRGGANWQVVRSSGDIPEGWPRPVRISSYHPMTAEKDVMERAVEGRSVHHRRRLIFVFALLAAALVPLAAIGAANDWWFLKNGSAPAPTSAPQVVKEGKWDGQPWQLMAYPSASNGLCFSITPKGSGATGEGGAASCGPFVGFESGASPEPITALVGGGSAKLPAYIAGLVIDEASVVEVRFPDGNVMRVAT